MAERNVDKVKNGLPQSRQALREKEAQRNERSPAPAAGMSDKELALTYELGRWQDKVSRLQAENKRLRKQVSGGLREINDNYDAMVASFAVAFGKEDPENTYTAEVPAFSVEGVHKNFDFAVQRTDHKTYMICVTQKAPDKEVRDNAD